jgi:putative ABC transport system ATP-binding protein
MVTHDAQAAAMADQVFFLADGRIVQQLPRSNRSEILAAIETMDSR